MALVIPAADSRAKSYCSGTSSMLTEAAQELDEELETLRFAPGLLNILLARRFARDTPSRKEPFELRLSSEGVFSRAPGTPNPRSMLETRL